MGGRDGYPAVYLSAYTDSGAPAHADAAYWHTSRGPSIISIPCGAARTLDGILMAACHVEPSWHKTLLWARFSSNFCPYNLSISTKLSLLEQRKKLVEILVLPVHQAIPIFPTVELQLALRDIYTAARSF